jgi:hypothetical protein
VSRPKFHGLTYEDLAERWSLTICGGDCGLPAYRHAVGWRAPDGVVHWAPRHMTTVGLWRFLKAVYHLDLGPEWLRIYRSNINAYTVAREELRIRLPAEITFADRRRVRYLGRYARLRMTHPAVYDWAYYPTRVKLAVTARQ